MGIPHPIPYQGSKRSLAQNIIALFPEDCSRLIEPFAGSAAVSIAAAFYGKATSFIINDLNAPLMDLWNSIIIEPEMLSAAYERLWIAQCGREREFYDQVRDEFNQTHRPELLLYLLARCVKAAIRYNSSGEFNQSPDNRRKGTHPATMRKNISGVSSLLRGKSSLSSYDYRIVLDSALPSDLVYMDPPYQGVCGNRDPRYLEGLPFQHFVDSLRKLNTRDISYIVSYDGSTGEKTHGRTLPPDLELTHIKLKAGRSSQATLLGRDWHTIESLYLSPALTHKIGDSRVLQLCESTCQTVPKRRSPQKNLALPLCL